MYDPRQEPGPGGPQAERTFGEPQGPAGFGGSGGGAAAGQGGGLPPWERRDRFGFLNGLYLTVKDVLVAPHRMFAGMRADAGLGQPLLFALVIGVCGAFVAWMWTLTGSSLQFLLQDRLDGGVRAPVLSLAAFLASPIAVALTVFLKAGLIHLMLILLGGSRSAFEATFRVAAYAEASDILSLVPFCGSGLGFFWNLAILIAGLHAIHRIEPWKAVVAVAVPMALCLAAFAGSLGLILLGLA